jgi:DNA-binding CsgD family transcriptional regulator
MRTTAAESKKKSTNCANDFWAFYLQNKKRIDDIIIAQTYRFRNVLDLDDMKQDILLLLIKNNFLESYDPKQSGIYTYLTNKVWGYAWHLHTLSHPTQWKPSYRSKERKPWEQILFYDLNGVCDLNGRKSTDTFWQDNVIPDNKEDSWEAEYSCQEIVERIRGHLSPMNQKVLDMLVGGMNAREIGEALGVTPPAVMYRMKKIRVAFRHAARKELVTA